MVAGRSLGPDRVAAAVGLAGIGAHRIPGGVGGLGPPHAEEHLDVRRARRSRDALQAHAGDGEAVVVVEGEVGEREGCHRGVGVELPGLLRNHPAAGVEGVDRPAGEVLVEIGQQRLDVRVRAGGVEASAGRVLNELRAAGHRGACGGRETRRRREHAQILAEPGHIDTVRMPGIGHDVREVGRRASGEEELGRRRERLAEHGHPCVDGSRRLARRRERAEWVGEQHVVGEQDLLRDAGVVALVVDVRRRRGQSGRHALEGDGRQRWPCPADDVETEAVERNEEPVGVGPATVDDVGDLVPAPIVLGADEAERADRPGIVDVRAGDGRHPVGRVGGGEQAGEVGERVGVVTGQVLVDALEAGPTDHVAAGVDPRRLGDDVWDRRELELVEQVVEERHAGAGRRTIAGERLDTADVVLARAVVGSCRGPAVRTRGVEFGGRRVAGRQRGVEPRRRCVVHQPGRAQAL